MSVKKTEFGTLSDSRVVNMFTIENKKSMSVSLIDYGAAIVKLQVPDKDGKLADVVCGYDDISSYENANGYHGATVGRVANRICGGKLTILDNTYDLYINNGENHLHGGKEGFNKKLWKAETLRNISNTVIMTYVSEDKEENYPGKLTVKVTYSLTDNNELVIHYEAVTNKETVVNLTNHSYFNLAGYDNGNIFDHVLTMDADTYLPTDDGLIPTGEYKNVKDTPFDFRTGKKVGKDIFDDDKDLKIAGGYDHCFNFTEGEVRGLCHRITLFDEKSGRKMKLITNYPSIQLYTANFMNNNNFPFKNNIPQENYNALCLEAQFKPDSVNHENFDNIFLRVGEVYNKSIILEFSAE